MSYGRIENYSGSAIRILQIKDDKKIMSWSKREIEQVHKTIADSAYENSVKKDTLTALKRLYHFAVHDEIVIKAKGIEYDPVVSWITPGSFVDRFEKIQSKDLLTDDEILQLIQTIPVGDGPHGLRTSLDNSKLYVGVTRTNEIIIIDTQSLTIQEKLPVGNVPFWIASPGNY